MIRSGSFVVFVVGVLLSLNTLAGVKLTKIAEYDIPKLGCGGIAYVGGDGYLVLQDHDDSTGAAMVYPATIKVNGDTGALSGISFSAGIPLGGNGDSEGIACDLCSGGIWVSDETGPTIKEFVLNADKTAYVCSRMAPMPEIYKKIRGNKGLEALTISGDGLTMWTANEESLQCDGPASAENVATTVRLTKFVRADIHGDWKVVGQWPYQCMAGFSSAAQSYCGLSGLCALPDGSLLTLEREVSTSSHGSCTVFLVTAEAIAGATPILNVPSLDGVQLVYVKDRWADQLRYFAGTDYGHMIVYEGICLGPRLSDGSLSVILVSDGGASQSAAGITAYTVPRLCAMKLSGIGEVETVNFAKPPVGTSSLVGNNFRFLKGSRVTVNLSDVAEPNPYAVDGTIQTACSGWGVTAGTPSSGSGVTASFEVINDGAFAWNMCDIVANRGYHVTDSFERFVVGSGVSSMAGWNGGACTVVATAYAPPIPPGYVMKKELHTKVLDAEDDEAVRNIPPSAVGNEKVDVMVCLRRPFDSLKPLPEDIQLRVASDLQGRLCIWHLYEDAGEWRKGWEPLSETVYEDGEWVRIGVEFDYTSNAMGDAFAKITVNGSCRPTSHGVRSPTDTKTYGPWHYLAKNRLAGGVSPLREISFCGTKVDDLMLCKQVVELEHEGPTSVDGIDFNWFDDAGLPRDPEFVAPFIPNYTLGNIHDAGIDPYSDRPLEVTDFAVGANGVLHLKLNGYRGDNPVSYRLLRSDMPDFKSSTIVDSSEGVFAGDAETHTTTWTGKPFAFAPDAEFYRVEAVR